MSATFTTDNVLHVAGGFLKGAAIAPALWLPWLLGPSLFLEGFVTGYIREVAQKDNDWLRPLTSFHSMMEAMAWGVGKGIAGGTASLLWYLL